MLYKVYQQFHFFGSSKRYNYLVTKLINFQVLTDRIRPLRSRSLFSISDLLSKVLYQPFAAIIFKRRKRTLV